MKPDVSAPGVDVRSCIPGDSYWPLSGTSMAAPHVAGLVALLIETNPSLAGDVDQIETIINESALPRTTAESCGGVPGSQVPNNTYGWGRIDALAAYDAALALVTGVDEEGGAPAATRLSANRPNPFNPVTRIDYTIRERSDVTLRIYDVTGRLVRELVRESGLPAGSYEATWDGLDDSGAGAPSGVYFYRLEAAAFAETRRMVLVR
jgi:subtilisin family serine protease